MLRVCREASGASNSDYFPPIFTNSVSAIFWVCIGNNVVGQRILCIRSVNESYYCEIPQNNVMQCIESKLRCLEVPFTPFNRVMHHSYSLINKNISCPW